DNSNNQELDVYVRDTVRHTTTYLSRGHAGSDDSDAPPVDVASDGPSASPSMSADGRYVAFETEADNIAEGAYEGFGHTVVICDRGPAHPDGSYGTGCVYTSLRLDEDGDDETSPHLSANAGRVALLSDGVAEIVELHADASGAIAPVTGADVAQPAVPETIDCAGTTEYLTEDTQVALSADGRYLVRVSRYETESASCGLTDAVWVNDLGADVPAQRLDLDAQGHFIGSQRSTSLGEIAVSGNGRRVAFVVDDDRVTDTEEIPFVVRAVDRDPDGDGVLGPTPDQKATADIVSRDVSGAPVGGDDPSFSTDGRYLAFTTDAPNVHNGADVPDREASCINQPVIGAYARPLSPSGGGRPVAGGRTDARRAPGTTTAGRRLAPAADTGISTCDVVVRDLVVDARRAAAGLGPSKAELASPSMTAGCEPPSDVACEGDADSVDPVLDADGSAVAFVSAADDLVAGDDNERDDVYLRRFLPTVSVGPLDFGQVALGTSASATTTVTYQGFGPLPVGPVTVGGTNAGDFDVFPGQTCTGTVLHDGDTCMVSVRFRPGQLGARTGTLTVAPVAGPPEHGRPGTGTLSGTGVPAPPPRTPGFSAAPDPLAFGTQPLFRNAPAGTVTVTNPGTAPLNVTAVALVGTAPNSFPGDYAITADSCLAGPIAPGATCLVTVVFAPHAIGNRPGLLQFTDNAVPGPQLVALTGAGAAPTLTALPPLAPPGAVSQVSGAGSPPGKPVVVTLDGMPGQLTVTASGTGTFTVPLVIFPHTLPGKRLLHATVQGVPGPIVVSIDYLVVPGSLQPPDFAERR
ncbi:MAG TPA: choice-of-anchor D domain-containing protein, partial [Rugosimonospora sp.]